MLVWIVMRLCPLAMWLRYGYITYTPPYATLPCVLHISISSTLFCRFFNLTYFAVTALSIAIFRLLIILSTAQAFLAPVTVVLYPFPCSFPSPPALLVDFGYCWFSGQFLHPVPYLIHPVPSLLLRSTSTKNFENYHAG